MRNTEKTFGWIVEIIRKRDIPFQISGGLAAKSYGSHRPLNDIDIDVPDDRLYDLVPDVRQYIVFGPTRYQDKAWDLLLMTLVHEEQEIDISGGYGLRICDARTGEWHPTPNDFSRYEERDIFGIRVPVIAPEELIRYKKMLTGSHQQVDIEAVEASLSRR